MVRGAREGKFCGLNPFARGAKAGLASLARNPHNLFQEQGL